MNEEKLAKEFEAYKELAKQDKKVDVASLMINALQKQQTNLLTVKEKRWAYLISLGLPPFGLLFAIKFYYSGKDDGEEAAWICGLLTAFSIFFFVLFAKLLFTSSGLTVDQVKNINIEDAKSLYQ